MRPVAMIGWLMVGLVLAGPAMARETPGNAAAPDTMVSGDQDMRRMMGPGMMGGGMMGHGMMGMCPFMANAKSKVEITKLPKGFSMTVTSDDPKVVARMQKMAEAMRLMREAMNE